MDAQLEVKLIECLDALAQGEPVEQILTRYPQESAQLRPMLAAAAGLPTLRLGPSEAMKMKSRQNFLAQAEVLRRTSPRKAMGFLPRFAVGFLAAAIVAIVLSTGAVTASGSALPGDPLYGLKRTVENVRLSTAGSPVVREELQLEFDQRRRDETNELLDAGRTGEVEFTGVIESIQPNAWIVSGLAIQLDANTQINGTPQINRVAEVRGMTGPTGLRASSISIESPGKSDITPTPEATEVPQPTETPEPAKTSAPTITLTPQPTVRTRPTLTTTPRPTATTESVAIEFTGNVNAIAAGTWNIDGTTIIVDNNTEVRGSVNVGQRVKIKAVRFADGRLVATRIEPTDSGNGSRNQNVNDNQNGNENQNVNGNSNDNSNSGDDHGGSSGNDNGGNGGSGDNSGNSNSNSGGGGSGDSGKNGNGDHGGDNSNSNGGG